MEYVNLGGTGLHVSHLCLGMMGFGAHEERPWAIDEAAAEPIVRRAIEGGVTFFDTADVYNGGESEVVTGHLLGKLLTREEFVVATKVYGQTMPGENGQGLSRKHILASIDASLRRLGLDYVDLYQTHRWDDRHADWGDDGRVTRRRQGGQGALHRRQQHVRVAVRRSPGSPRPHETGRRFVSMQNHYNLLYREEEREMIPHCVDQGVAVIPWTPLARGILAGNRTTTGERLTVRANSDTFGDSLYRPRRPTRP